MPQSEKRLRFFVFHLQLLPQRCGLPKVALAPQLLRLLRERKGGPGVRDADKEEGQTEGAEVEELEEIEEKRRKPLKTLVEEMQEMQSVLEEKQEELRTTSQGRKS